MTPTPWVGFEPTSPLGRLFSRQQSETRLLNHGTRRHRLTPTARLWRGSIPWSFPYQGGAFDRVEPYSHVHRRTSFLILRGEPQAPRPGFEPGTLQAGEYGIATRCSTKLCVPRQSNYRAGAERATRDRGIDGEAGGSRFERPPRGPILESCHYTTALVDCDIPNGTASECEWIRTTAFLHVRETS